MQPILALIPARGGSKGVPRKNIRPLGGKPLLAWTVETAKACPLLDRVLVSTEDAEIAQVAKNAGAEVPFVRPMALAQDETSSIDVVHHTLNWLKEHQGYEPKWVLWLQPTSPFRRAEDIEGAISLANQKDAECVVSVTEASQHPYWVKKLGPEGQLQDFVPLDTPITRRQELPPAYALNGAIYLARSEVLLEKKSWYTRDTYAYPMPQERSLDIDRPWDFMLAELLIERSLAAPTAR